MTDKTIELKQEDFNEIDFSKIKNIPSVEVVDGKMVISIEGGE